ncbi:uncharacterized protein ARMOST_19832 [Armillaria ostoyae]|uniref:Uncharacterized protein n=1 Tax=Armillaria ostoyae TaxID=47428 RepID=A0A284S5L8_ARMOS|nr:uncharacterized protein ARMOST_19832 [Armillaria ostoyae]
MNHHSQETLREGSHRQLPPPPPPGGPNDPDDPNGSDGSHGQDRAPQRSGRSSGGNGPLPPPPPRGDDGGGDGSGSSGDESDNHPRRNGQMGSYQSSTIPCGARNEEAYSCFHGLVHDRICRFIDDHLMVCLRLPEGVKPPQLDIKSVKPYDGDPSMEILWDWLKSLVIHLETQQLGGPDHDWEQKLIIELVLTGKAKKWYHDHVIEIDNSHEWTFTTEAQTKFEKATFMERGGSIEGFRDLLESYIRNMTLKPDDYIVWKLFMKRIPPAMRNAILEDHLRVELNTLDELVLSGKAWEDTERSKKEYMGRDMPLAHKAGDRASSSRDQP